MSLLDREKFEQYKAQRFAEWGNPDSWPTSVYKALADRFWLECLAVYLSLVAVLELKEIPPGATPWAEIAGACVISANAVSVQRNGSIVRVCGNAFGEEVIARTNWHRETLKVGEPIPEPVRYLLWAETYATLLEREIRAEFERSVKDGVKVWGS